MMKQNPLSSSHFFFFFFFLLTYNFPIFWKGRRKTVYVVLVFDEVYFRFLSLFFYGWVTSPKSAESASFSADFCPKTKDSFYGRFSPELTVNRHLSPPTSVPKTEDSFSQISLTEKWHFGAKGLWANHLTFSFSHYSIRSRYSSDLDSCFCSTDCRS